MVEHGRWPGQPDRRRARHDRAQRGRQGVPARRGPRVLPVRPRGLHLPERHLLVDGEPVAGAFVDFGLYLFHNARELLERGAGPYFYIPKLESAPRGARCGATPSLIAEHVLGLERGTIRATVLIETVPRRVRDGRDPLGAARGRGRAERRALGLHLLDDQALQVAPGVRPARPLRGEDDRPVHARVHELLVQDLPSRAPTPWAGWRR